MSLIRNNSQQQGCCGDMCMFSSFMGCCLSVTYLHTRHLEVHLAQHVSQVPTTAPDDGDLQKQTILSSHDYSPPPPRIAVAIPVQATRPIKRHISFLHSPPTTNTNNMGTEVAVFCNEGRDSEMGDSRSISHCPRRAHFIHC